MLAKQRTVKSSFFLLNFLDKVLLGPMEPGEQVENLSDLSANWFIGMETDLRSEYFSTKSFFE